MLSYTPDINPDVDRFMDLVYTKLFQSLPAFAGEIERRGEAVVLEELTGSKRLYIQTFQLLMELPLAVVSCIPSVKLGTKVGYYSRDRRSGDNITKGAAYMTGNACFSISVDPQNNVLLIRAQLQVEPSNLPSPTANLEVMISREGVKAAARIINAEEEVVLAAYAAAIEKHLVFGRSNLDYAEDDAEHKFGAAIPDYVVPTSLASDQPIRTPVSES